VSAGFIYAFWHPKAPANKNGKVRVKIGRSAKEVWGNHHERRGEKLAFAFDMFGFQRQQNVFPPIAVADQRASEKKLKAELREYSVKVENGGRCEEAFDLPQKIFDALKSRTSI
jgi:hypothetical protein